MAETVVYDVQGMTCGGCQRALLTALKGVGIQVTPEDISVSDGTLRLRAVTADAAVFTAVEAAGFRAQRRQAP